MTPPPQKKKLEFLKMTPQQNIPLPHPPPPPPPHSSHIKDQPPTALRLGIQEFTDPGLHWQDPAVLTSL